MKTTIIFLVVFAIAGFAPPADVKLQYKFKAGDEYLWTQETKQTIKQNVMGNDQSLESIYQSEFLVKVAEVNGTGAKLEVVFKRLMNSSKSVQGSKTMDSNGSQDQLENKIFKSIIDKPFHVFLSNSGNVEKVENGANLWSDFGKLGLDAQTETAMRQSLETMLGEQALKSSFQSAFIPYSDKKVKVGDKWSTSHDVVAGFALTVDNTWSVESLGGSSANLYGEGVYKTVEPDKVFSVPGGMKAKSNFDGKQAVKSSVNPKTGWPSKQEMLLELKGTMTLLAGGMIPQDMEIPTEILAETTYSVTKK